MKSHFKSVLLIFSIILITGCFGGLSKKESGIDKDYLALQEKSAKAKSEIELNKLKVTEKAKSFAHATVYTLTLETNKTPEIKTASEFARYTQLTLGNPSVEDARRIEDIADGLIKEARNENLKLRIEASTNKVEIDYLRSQIKATESEAKSARQKMEEFQEMVGRLQLNEDKLKSKYEGELSKLNKENLENAEKAKIFDNERGFLASLNPFTDLVNFVKKLFTLSIVCGLLFLAFKILEVFFPALNLLSMFGSMVIGVVKKILPGAIQGAGLVGKSVLNTLSQVVQSNQSFMKTLKEMPIEDDLIKSYPDDYIFEKKEVKELLLALTDKTLAELQKELDKNLNEETRGVVTYVKAASGIKDERPVTSLI